MTKLISDNHDQILSLMISPSDWRGEKGGQKVKWTARSMDNKSAVNVWRQVRWTCTKDNASHRCNLSMQLVFLHIQEISYL